jgi:hypothetical protein
VLLVELPEPYTEIRTLPQATQRTYHRRAAGLLAGTFRPLVANLLDGGIRPLAEDGADERLVLVRDLGIRTTIVRKRGDVALLAHQSPPATDRGLAHLESLRRLLVGEAELVGGLHHADAEVHRVRSRHAHLLGGSDHD